MTSTQSLFSDILASDKQKAVRSAADAVKSTSKDKPENELSIVESGQDPRSDNSHSKKGKSSSSVRVADKRKVPTVEDVGFSKLGDIMKTGFENMQKSMLHLGSNIADKIVHDLAPLHYYDDLSDRDLSDELECDRASECSVRADESNVFMKTVKRFFQY